MNTNTILILLILLQILMIVVMIVLGLSVRKLNEEIDNVYNSVMWRTDHIISFLENMDHRVIGIQSYTRPIADAKVVVHTKGQTGTTKGAK